LEDSTSMASIRWLSEPSDAGQIVLMADHLATWRLFPRPPSTSPPPAVPNAGQLP
jgi:hypothetical protein